MSSNPHGNGKDPVRVGQSDNEDDSNPPPRSRPRSRTLGISGSIPWCPRPAAPVLRPGSPMVVDTSPVAAPVPPSVAPDLPFDVLTIIFQLWHAMEYDRVDAPYSVVPFRAGGVCRSWREAARDTPRLWTRATFNFRRMQGRGSWRAYHAAHATCAGGHEYDVYLDSNLVKISKSDPIWRLFRERILPRARSILIEVRFEGTDEDILSGCFLPSLRRLEISASRHFHYVPAVLLHFDAPLITTLQTSFVSPSQLDSPPPGDPFSIIAKFDCAFSTVSLGDLECLMQVFASLQELRLSLQLFEASPNAPLIWSGLRRLTIDTVALDADHLRGQLYFPDLEELAVRDDPDHWAFWALLIERQCPALTSLVVLRNHQDNAAPFVEHMAGLSCIRTLVFRAGSMNNDLLDLLVGDDATRCQIFPSLDTLIFEDTVPRSDIDLVRIWSLIYWRNNDIRERGSNPNFRIACSMRRRDTDGAESGEENNRRAELEEIVAEMSTFLAEQYFRLFR